MRPDVSAPGCEVGGDGGVRSTGSSSNSAYSTLCGTSMASPTVCGIGSLMIQYHRQLFPGTGDLRNSTLKALLAHNAVDRGAAGPDYQFGYGSVRADATIEFMETRGYLEDEVSQGTGAEYVVNVAPGTGEFKATLAWDDFPGTPNVATALVNDLDLVVIDPNGVRHYPWTLNPVSPATPAARSTENRVDNIEQVLVDNPAAGQWQIIVEGFNVPEGPQPFSLVTAGDLAGLTVSQAAGTDLVPPGQPVDVTFNVFATGQDIVAGSASVFYRTSPTGPFQQAPATSPSANSFTATLPGVNCDDTLEYYFQVEGDTTGVATAPRDAPSDVFSPEIGEIITVATDNLETDTGWVVGAPGDTATTGIWDRADPEGTDAQPEDDTTPDGVNAWVTGSFAGGSLGANDIDGGATTLTSRVFDLSNAPDPVIGYNRWYSNSAGASPNQDVFRVQISNNGGATWNTVEIVGPSGSGTSGGWFRHEFRVLDIVTPTDNVRLRFIAEDADPGSLVEAAIDDVEIVTFDCSFTPVGCDEDISGDGTVDVLDLNRLLAVFNQPASADPDADISGDGVIDVIDLNQLLGAFNTTCP
jgi:hypothetical protein